MAKNAFGNCEDSFGVHFATSISIGDGINRSEVFLSFFFCAVSTTNILDCVMSHVRRGITDCYKQGSASGGFPPHLCLCVLERSDCPPVNMAVFVCESCDCQNNYYWRNINS